MKTDIIVSAGFILAIVVVYMLHVPMLYLNLPDPPEEVLFAMTPAEYAKLSEQEKLKYGKWEWQDITFWCPHCRVQYTIKVEPRTEYFRYIAGNAKYFVQANSYGVYFPNISFWVIQLTSMEYEKDKPWIIKCQKCDKVFSLPTLDGWPYGRRGMRTAGVSGYR